MNLFRDRKGTENGNYESDLQQEDVEIQSICKFSYYLAFSSKKEFKHKDKNILQFCNLQVILNHS